MGAHDGHHARLGQDLGHIFLGLGIKHAQGDQVVDVTQDLARFGLAAGAGGEVGEGLGSSGQTQAGTAALVQQFPRGSGRR